jgi:hypothetical protein
MKTPDNNDTDGTAKEPEKRRRVIDLAPPPQTQPEPPKRKRPRVLQTYTVDEVIEYQPPVGADLIAEGFIELGETALLYGPPGSFKGFIVGDLQRCGAIGHGHWLGFEVKTQFASLWLNCENGRKRLKKQFSGMDLPPEAREFIHVTGIPDVLSLANPELIEDIREDIIKKNIKLLIVDTVSNFCADEQARDFSAFFDSLHRLFVGLEIKPAVLLIHHSRKPKAEDKSGRALLNLISGHQTIQRRSRTIIYAGRVTEGFKETRVAVVALKVSNNGELEGEKIAVQLNQKLALEEIPDFDWSVWEKSDENGDGQKKDKSKIRLEHLQEVFKDGPLTRQEATRKLITLCECGDSAVSDAIGKTRDGQAKGRLCYAIEETGGGMLLRLKAEHLPERSPFDDDDPGNE